ncbi:unnamed protein product, partial [Leptidea sinapis]
MIKISKMLEMYNYDYFVLEVSKAKQHKMELLHVIIKSGPSPRPLAWSLEVSSTQHGEDWRMIRAFGDRDHCKKLWDLRPDRRRRKARGTKRAKEKLTCSTQFANPKPLENGETFTGRCTWALAKVCRPGGCACHSVPRTPRLTHTTPEQNVTVCTEPAEVIASDAVLVPSGNLVSLVTSLRMTALAGNVESVPLMMWEIFCASIVRRNQLVECTCHPGFSGPKCEWCEDVNAVFPNCLLEATTPACKCDPRGIVDPSRVVLPLGEAWIISDAAANETLEPSIDEEGKPFLITYEVEGWESFYWLSRSWSGGQLESYGGEIRASLYWGVARGDTGGSPTVGPDLSLNADLIEGMWYSEGEAAPVSRSQLMAVLADLSAVMIRAHFHNDQDEVAREVCSCPTGYEGSHCSECSWTHVRIHRATGTSPTFECVPCPCNMHASCTTVNGVCGPCQHNTTGLHCERCLPGFYGNPVTGGCKRCACPLYDAANNFSPNCALAGPDGDEYVCTQCPDGYAGDHCEICDSGYWGSPQTAGGACVACECGGGPCHSDTGRCLVCPPHAEGERCDQCQEGYWSGAQSKEGIESGCVECACGRGALSAACDTRSGQCACDSAWTGRACDTCAPGYGGMAGCPMCRCGIAAVNKACDMHSGACECAPGAAPPLCDTCLIEHYDLSAQGCQ